MWTGPIDVAIDELFIIVGPNIGSYMSHEDSYIENEDGKDEPYDPSNMYNIFDNQIKLKRKHPNSQGKDI